MTAPPVLQCSQIARDWLWRAPRRARRTQLRSFTASFEADRAIPVNSDFCSSRGRFHGPVDVAALRELRQKWCPFFDGCMCTNVAPAGLFNGFVVTSSDTESGVIITRTRSCALTASVQSSPIPRHAAFKGMGKQSVQVAGRDVRTHFCKNSSATDPQKPECCAMRPERAATPLCSARWLCLNERGQLWCVLCQPHSPISAYLQ
jgi:hypothetical protein